MFINRLYILLLGMQIKLDFKLFPEGYEITFTNDPIIEQYFRETSLERKSEYMGKSCYVYQYVTSVNDKYFNYFQNSSRLYEYSKPVLTILSTTGKNKFYFKGLNDIEKWKNDFERFVKEFVADVIRPYFYTKKYVEFKNNKIVNNKVVNKEGYEKLWYSYYRNYKKYILDYNEGLVKWLKV